MNRVATGLVVAGLGVLAMVAPLGGTAQAASVSVVSQGNPAIHDIALTFDDGVSPANCRRILAILVDEQVPATFFPLAQAMRLDPAFWRLVVQAGYPVGNHSLTHPQMPDLDLAGQVHQIEAARALEDSILGRASLDVFRPPYGAYNAITLAAAATAGYPTLLTWSESDRDTSPTGHEPAMLAAAELGGNGSVILLHCGPNATPYLLRPLIEYYRSRGFRFVTIAQMFGLTWSPGPTSAVTPATILDGLSALPATSSGGVITGPNGWSPPPTPRTTPDRSSAVRRTASAPASDSGSSTATAGAQAVVPARPTPGAPVAPVAPVGGSNAGWLVVALLGLASVAGGLALVLRARWFA